MHFDTGDVAHQASATVASNSRFGLAGAALGLALLISTVKSREKRNHDGVKVAGSRSRRWLREGAADGFTVTFPYVPEGLDDVVQKLVPELQRRGLFRTDYEGSTLREHLGLPRPENRFFPKNQ